MTATCQTGAANVSIKAIEDAINAWRNRQPTPSTGDRVAAKRRGNALLSNGLSDAK